MEVIPSALGGKGPDLHRPFREFFVNGVESRPRYQINHERLRDSVSNLDKPILRSHSYFLDAEPDQVLEILRLP